MEFISTEEFLKQSKEVQKVFLDWWEWETFDLFSDKNARSSKYSLRYVINNNLFISLDDKEVYTYSVVPLLIEGQLRQFIEDKTGYKVTLVQSNSLPIEIWLSIGKNTKRISSIDKFDVLQAYWKVACEIAKEEV